MAVILDVRSSADAMGDFVRAWKTGKSQNCTYHRHQS